MEKLTCDVLVVGSGGAGLRAAVAAREEGLEVLVVGKASPGKSTSTIWSGGAFSGSLPGRTAEAHRKLTLRAGRGINQVNLVEILVRENPERLRELMAWGLPAEIHRGDLFVKGRAPVMGEGIVRCLSDRAEKLGVRFASPLTVVRLRMDEGTAHILAYDGHSGKWTAISSRAVVLATGGAGALFHRHDNPRRMLGEGYLLALEAGAVLLDMEFVQFYPLVLAEPELPRYLIPPGVADCGRLFNADGEDILQKYGIEERPAALKARDRLSQALFREERGGSAVWLDLREVPQEAWETDPFSAAEARLLKDRCGIGERPLRIAPAAHHVMGGALIDENGLTSVPGLFAAGEVTGGLHGANRMGGNALTETQVFGARAGKSAAAWAKTMAGKKLSAAQPPEPAFSPSRLPEPSAIQAKLDRIMWEKGGILRNRQGLAGAIEEIRELHHDLGKELPRDTKPRDIRQYLELRMATEVALLILQSASMREESRGAHFREDFPEQDDSRWQGHIRIRRGLDGTDDFSFHPYVNGVQPPFEPAPISAAMPSGVHREPEKTG